MRFALVVLVALLSSSASAQERYENARFGYGIAVPPDFVGQGESDSGDGQSFALSGKPTSLMVWGGVVVGDFEREVSQRQYWDESQVWTIAQQVTTPRWANYGAVKGSRMVFQRMMLLCGGPNYAAFRLEYSVTDAGDMAALIDRLVPSLQPTGC